MPVSISKISPYRSPNDVLGYLLRLLSLLWHRRLDEELAKIDLTEMQFVLLIGLGWMTERGEWVTQAELAEFCTISPALASQVMRSLTRKKLVRLRPNANDGRSRVLQLSETGEARLVKAVAVLERVDKEFWEGQPKLVGELRTNLQAAAQWKLGSPAASQPRAPAQAASGRRAKSAGRAKR
jgi:MarR family transcriptional regulator, organic hydroperoxide resistance regulator